MLNTISVNNTSLNLSAKLGYSVEEASELTSLSKAFLRLEIKRGKLKVKRFGRRVVIYIEDLKKYLNSGSDENQLA